MTKREAEMLRALALVIFTYAAVIIILMYALVSYGQAAETVSLPGKPIPPCNPGLDRYLCGHPQVQPGKEYVITHDIGGMIQAYIDRFKELKDTHIVVDGLCNSACTLVLSNKDVCATHRAFFGFHSASSPSGTNLLMYLYPDHVKKWILDRGGLTPKVIFARGYELAPVCKEKS